MRKIKDFLKKRLGIAELRRRIGWVEYSVEQLSRENIELRDKIADLETLLYSQYCSLNNEKRSPRLVVSLTSFPARIKYVPIVLKRMLTQTVKPDEIVLYLSKEQFPLFEKELPTELLEMKNYGIKIAWCEGDIKAYKKFIPALQQYSEDIIVIIDDDLIYPTDHLEKLVKAHEMFPDSIIASRVHEIKYDESGKIIPYSMWQKECCYDTYQIKQNWFFTGGAGTLLPPHVFKEEILNVAVIENLCPWADDIWLNIHAAIANASIVNIATNAILRRIDGTQENRLEDINCFQNQNDVQLKNVMDYYKKELAKTIYLSLE